MDIKVILWIYENSLDQLNQPSNRQAEIQRVHKKINYNDFLKQAHEAEFGDPADDDNLAGKFWQRTKIKDIITNLHL